MRNSHQAAIVLWLGAAIGCASPTPGTRVKAASEVPTLRVVTGSPEDPFFVLGRALVRVCRDSLPALTFTHVATAGSLENVRAIQQAAADIGLAQADTAYVASQGRLPDDPVQYNRLRGIAVLHLNALHLLVRTTANIREVSDLRGRRLSIAGHRGGNTELLVRILLEANGLSLESVQVEWLPLADAVARLRGGDADALVGLGRIPVPSVEQVLTDPKVHLLPINGGAVRNIRGRYPFLRPVDIPVGSYSNQSGAVRTVGTDVLLVCREELDASLVYRVTKAVFESFADVTGQPLPGGWVDLERSAATPIPLHPGAAQYFRELVLFR